MRRGDGPKGWSGQSGHQRWREAERLVSYCIDEREWDMWEVENGLDPVAGITPRTYRRTPRGGVVIT